VKKRSGPYPALAVDGQGSSVVPNAGSVVLLRSPEAVGLRTALSEAVRPWRRRWPVTTQARSCWTWPSAWHSAGTAWPMSRRARRPKVAKLVGNDRLREYVQDRLSGVIRTDDGQDIGPAGPRWKGRNKPHRGDRR
jgi:hypothetical protein